MALLRAAGCGFIAASCALVGDIEEKSFTATDAGSDAGADAPVTEDAEAGSSKPGYYDLDRPGRPPSRPSGAAPGQPKLAFFAARRVYFGGSVRGTTDRDPNGWKQIGWDLDGLASTKEQVDKGTSGTCKSSGDSKYLQDGADGRDNAVGASMMQFISDADPNGEHVANQGIEAGVGTVMLMLSDVHSFDDDPHVSASLYLLADDRNTPWAPKWDGSDVRRVHAASFVPGTELAITNFPDGYIRNGVWVSGDQHKTGVTVVIPIYVKASIAPMLLSLPGRGGWLTANVKGGKGGPGAFGFSLTSGELYLSFYELFRRAFSCSPDTGMTHNLVKSFQPHVDVVGATPWAPDPKAPCDSLSWGIDVEWAPIQTADIEHPVDQATLPPCDGPGPNP